MKKQNTHKTRKHESRNLAPNGKPKDKVLKDPKSIKKATNFLNRTYVNFTETKALLKEKNQLLKCENKLPEEAITLLKNLNEYMVCLDFCLPVLQEDLEKRKTSEQSLNILREALIHLPTAKKCLLKDLPEVPKK